MGPRSTARLPESVAQTSPAACWVPSVTPMSVPPEAARTPGRSQSHEVGMTPKVTAAPPPDSQGQLDESDLKAAELITKVYQRMTRHLGRVIVGQSEVVKQVLLALF